MADQNAEERVSLRIKQWAKQYGHGAGKALARAVSGRFGEEMSEQWASGIIAGAPLRLKHLDAVAELLGVPPGDLIRRNGDHYLEVIPSEMAFLAHLRTLPNAVRQHLSIALDYIFAFQSQALEAQKTTVDRRTKGARLLRLQEKSRAAAPPIRDPDRLLDTYEALARARK